jgi:Cu2+-exporting ATPase
MTEPTISTASFVTKDKNNLFGLNLLVDGMHCPSCVAIIENALIAQQGIKKARLNLSTKRLNLLWEGAAEQGDNWVALINQMGYKAVPFDPKTAETAESKEEKFLFRCLAVAGFASGNLMLFSVPLWSADTVEMGIATRTLFHWIQAIIAIPAIAYCGMPFYRSAWNALKMGRTNMDVPISVAVILATGMSLFETITFGRYSYFDSAAMLLFFLLIGRYLEMRARGKARSAAQDLLQMMTGSTTLLRDDGTQQTIPLSDIKEGMTLLIAAGERVGADGEVIQGTSEIDTSLITGETLPQAVAVGASLFAGTINIAAPLTLRVTKAGEKSLLSEIVRLMENAEQSQARYVTLADSISRWYTPVVHLLAAATFLGWLFWGDVSWQIALLYAATVLIITCPCALGLAVPVVQVLASSKLMRSGILLKSGSALERLARINYAVFDKTGTLTLGKPELLHPEQYSETQLQLAASLAVQSKHPLSRALAASYHGALLPLTITETSGFGLATTDDSVRLGKAEWCDVTTASTDNLSEIWLSEKGNPPLRFTFADQLRSDAVAVLSELQKAEIRVELLSGDRPEIVSAVAATLGGIPARASLTPLEKCTRLNELKASGAEVLMVGDGLNDAPSLASAMISMSPTSAMDITQNAADIVFQGEKLSPILTAWKVAKFSQVLVKENFILALGYNLIAIPLAVAGMVTPMIAAIAMSSSSLLVIANAMRLNLNRINFNKSKSS